MQRPRRPTVQSQRRLELVLRLTLFCCLAVEMALGQVPTAPIAPTTPGVPTPTPAPQTGDNNATDSNVTAAPIADASPPTVAPTVPPAPLPTLAPTSTPIANTPPTASPATGAPTEAPVTEAPIMSPVTKAPVTAEPIPATKAPVIAATPAPTPGPVAEPTTPAPNPVPGQKESTTVQGITAAFGQTGALPQFQYETFQQIVSDWFDGYYYQQENNNDQRQVRFRRQLQNTVSSMQSTVDITNQRMDGSVNIITYSQTMEYFATPDAPGATAIVLEPWNDDESTDKLAEALMQQLPEVFGNVATPLSPPTIVAPTPSPVPSNDDDEDTFWTTPVIIGIAVGGAVVLLLLAWLWWRYCCCCGGDEFKDHAQSHPDGHDAGGGDSLYNPPSQFGFSLGNDEDEISRMEDPTVAKSPDSDSIGGNPYGDQSVATVDYDYSKAYGGGGDASIVSSVGGTLGDNTRQTAGDVAAGSAAARAALGASFESNDQRPYSRPAYQEQVMVIDAPAGKLGVVIDTPDDGAPVVHAVKDSSVIADQIQVGDKLIAVDDEDVRSMTAIKVSKLISKKSANPSRRLTIVRSVPVHR